MATSRFEVTFIHSAPDGTEDEMAAVRAALRAFLGRGAPGERPQAEPWALAGRREAQGLPADRESLQTGWRD
jgi:hypothetical protein